MTKQSSLTLQIKTELPELAKGEAVAVCVFEGEPNLSNASGAVLKTVESVMRAGEFKGEDETSLLLHDAELRGALLLLGLGQHQTINTATLLRAAGTAARQARASRVKHLYFILPDINDRERIACAVAEGAVLGLYDGNFYQNREEPLPRLERLTLITTDASDALRAATERGRIIAESVNWTRALADEPGGTLPPIEFARRAAEMAEEFSLRVETLDADEIKARGMGGLWGVGKGSDNPPALIVVRYEPEGVEGVNEDDELWAFVGKGITFDTGGISIKHGLDMYEMKSDMAGGAAVLGALRAIAQLKLKRRVIGLVPSAENMPSGKAIKPGDVVKTLAGYTIEVVDTDAEGRLVLSDGLAYAKQLKASRIVDLATLTGSIIVALGSHRAGLFSNDDEWAKRVEEAAMRAGEPAWRMPVGDDYKKPIESAIADFKNYGGRPDATAAALLLSKFAGSTPWVHLDIAGTSWLDDARPFAPKGSTGAGVRTLVELVSES
ncbi:MAG: leucyl aminopeptidase [Acidobacteria bacterium]|nr:MAG: leucyl aminopeptidase [Acidobacteriota bacterium]